MKQTPELLKQHSSDSTEGLNPTEHREQYFAELYRDNADPWQYETRWYEKRKRSICLAILQKEHYQQAIELGCGNGVLSAHLASCCDQLICVDGNAQAVAHAKQRLDHLPNVDVCQGIVPSILRDSDTLLNERCPSAYALHSSRRANTKDEKTLETPLFDLIVISELLYYLSLTEIDEVLAWVSQSLASEGTLLCCHWRYDISGFALNGEAVHAYVKLKLVEEIAQSLQSFDCVHQTQVMDKDFLLDVWHRSSQSIAEQENLV